MSGDQQGIEAAKEAIPVASVDAPHLAPEPPFAPAERRRRHWSTAELWMLGIFSAVGLAGFIATFAMIVMRGPGAPARQVFTAVDMKNLAGAPGERGPAGPPGPAGQRGPAGDPGIRVVRADCTTGTCGADCADDEILLSAYCSPTRGPVIYPTEHSAACRPPVGRGRVEVVAACIKAARR